MTCKEFEKLTAGTCTHAVNLTKDGESFIGIYNGLSFWGKVLIFEKGEHLFVEQLQGEFDEEENHPFNFRESDFVTNGYTIT